MSQAGGESVIGRVVRLINAFDRNTRSMPLTALANRAGLPLTTTHRLVNELLKHGLLERGDDKEISIGLRLWEMSARGSDALTLREAALPYLDDLRSGLEQHIALAVLDSGTVLFLERLATADSTLDAGRMAERYPIHACSSGLVLLAYSSAEYQNEFLTRPLAPLTNETITDPAMLRRRLAEIRRQHYAYVPGAGITEWAGMAVPIFGAGNKVIAALNVIYPRGEANVQAAVPAMQITARSISRAIGALGARADSPRA